MKLKFKKYRRNEKAGVRWDANAEGETFYRIVIDNYGYYVCYFCLGLDANGITPLPGTYQVSRGLKLEAIKSAAQSHHNKSTAPKETPKPKYGGYYSSMYEARLPYKD